MFLITEFKRCRCCRETLPASAFSFNPRELRLESFCKQCRCDKEKARRLRDPLRYKDQQKANRLKNHEVITEGKKDYYARNKTEIRAKENAKNVANREAVNARNRENKKKNGKNWPSSSYEYGKQYKLENAERIKETTRVRTKVRMETDPNFKILRRLRTRAYHALCGRNKSAKTLELLGCSIEFLREYLEKQFQPGMTWENYGPIWHVDHIRPCDSFPDLSDPAQQRECFRFTNLQPLFASENLKKHATYVPIL